MGFHADLHVHSKYSRATSRDLDLEHLAAWACRKGIGVVATGDFTHPAWCAERSEEHTSELQSQSKLVCRLLLEKKIHAPTETITTGQSPKTPGRTLQHAPRSIHHTWT